MHKLFCYVDESGQDTQGRLFVVAVVVLAENRDELERRCLQYETESKKGSRKWNKSDPDHRLTYLRKIFNDTDFKGAFCVRVAREIERTQFDEITIATIARTLQLKNPETAPRSEIFVDGLSKSMQAVYATQLRRHGIMGARIHRVRDESNPLVRLADALAGFVREATQEERESSTSLLLQAVRQQIVIQV